MSESNKIAIKDGLVTIIDYRGKTPPKSSKGITLISAANIKSGSLDFTRREYISFKDYQTWTVRGFAQPGDILFTTEAPTGEVALYPEEGTFQISRRVIALRTDEKLLHNYYLFYALQAPLIKGKLLQSNRGSTVPRLLKTDITDFQFEVPSYKEQKAIADVLSCLDGKIENLRRQNETLEAIAQTLFKHWFMDFEFPNEDGKPYKSSGGAMIPSELGEIPEGWRVTRLENIVDTINGYSYKGTDLGESETALVNLKNFDRSGGFRLDGFKEILTNNYKKRHLVSPNDLLVAHTDLTHNAEVLGNPILIQPIDKYSRYVFSMDLVCVKSKRKSMNNFFLYYLLSTMFFKKHCVGYANGTTVLHLNKRAIPDFQFAMPKNYECILKFQKIAQSHREKITNNEKQIQTLTKTRDTLLPKLMSGQLRVKEQKL